ncbi:MAG: bestrophin family ion channel [Limnohabitans sp.]|nr:bestrophin family ion channel [Limnohabitans sp.]
MLTKNLPVKAIAQFSIIPILIGSAWSLLVVLGFVYLDLKWLAIPFLPISLLGIAVSFYVGFKNNAANERQNEARKNWGGITNDTRSLIAMLNTYLPENEMGMKTNILKRHIAWLYAHKSFLRHKRMDWEHNLKLNEVYREQFRQYFNINAEFEQDVSKYISNEEIKEVESYPNTASKILLNQSKMLKKLRNENLIEDFRLFELQNHITKLYEHQGRNERIKTFPIPRQFANYATLFIIVFAFLLPLGLINETQKINVWLTIPFSILVTWVFHQMDLVGDYSEHPFEGLISDTPMTAITRNLEIEILQSLGETNLPKPITAKNSILM